MVENTLDVVSNAQYVIECAGVFAEPQHLGPDVEHLGCGVRLDVNGCPTATVACGVAVLDYTVYCIGQHVAGAVLHHLNHPSQVRRVVGLSGVTMVVRILS